jgi:hypothetical protein
MPRWCCSGRVSISTISGASRHTSRSAPTPHGQLQPQRNDSTPEPPANLELADGQSRGFVEVALNAFHEGMVVIEIICVRGYLVEQGLYRGGG